MAIESVVWSYRLKDKPDTWLVVAGERCTLAAIKHHLDCKFPRRLLEIRAGNKYDDASVKRRTIA